MSYYGITFPEYWTGATGRAIQERGGKDATILGLYVTSARRANMIGLYHLPIEEIVAHTPLTRDEVIAALIVLATEDYAYYDPETEFIWVRQMARIRLALTPSRPVLDKRDNRVEPIRRLYANLAPNRFLRPFFQHYKSSLLLTIPRGAPLKDLTSPLKGLQGPPSQRSVDQEISTDQGSEIRRADQKSGSDKTTGASRRLIDAESKNQNAPQMWVYFARCADTVKIGYSGEVHERIRRLQAKTGQEVHLLGVVPAESRRTERDFHHRFRAHRITKQGEWFAADAELLTWITTHALQLRETQPWDPCDPPATRSANATPTFAQYCLIATDALAKSLTVDQTDDITNVIEWFKALCGERHLPYDGELSRGAVKAVLAAREKREVAAS